MLFKNIDTLNGTINVIAQLQLICIGVVADHSANFTEDLFKAISSQKDNPKATIRVILLCLCNTEVYILDYGHHIEEELDWDKVALVAKI
jgi:hypothetical protein